MYALTFLYKLLIGPLELFFEVLYAIAYRVVGDPGLTIIVLSLAMNFLVLPLYRRADAIQEQERQRTLRMKPWTDHIKKTFTGDERFMMLQTYNRQNGVKQTDTLKGSISLLLEIPFFIAAFHFLSHLELLQGVSFGPLADLGAPDALLSLGGMGINVLPILMTAINLVSAAIYMKGLPLANKVQMYGIAAIFLVLLYNSPSGLVFYWTLNNVFSLVKNIFYRLKNPGLVLSVLALLAGVALVGAGIYLHSTLAFKKTLFICALGVVLMLPLAMRLLRRGGVRGLAIPEASAADDRAFTLGCVFLAVLLGALIPTAVIVASPTEFVDAVSYKSPLWYVAESLALAAGTFVLWFGVFYRLMTPKGKSVFGCLLFACVGVAIIDYLFFGTGYGEISPQLQFDAMPVITSRMMAGNAAAVAVAAVLLACVWMRAKGIAQAACLVLCIAAAAMSGVNAFQVNSGLAATKAAASEDAPHFTLSREGRNVVVIMLDRSISYYVPYMMAEDPQLKEQFAGFTFYPNTVSYGIYTNVGAPPLYGGYEYTPEYMNARTDMLLGEKNDEALKVMPRIFAESGYDVTVFDPTYAGYSWESHLGIYDDLTGVSAYHTMGGQFIDESLLGSGASDAQQSRNFFCYGIFKVVPLAFQPTVYHGGDYNSTAASSLGSQIRTGSSISVGVDQKFMASYGALHALPSITQIVDGEAGGFLMMSNDTTHAPMVLSEPEYAPAARVDNTEFDREHEVRYAEDGSQIEFPPESGDREASRIMHYQVDMAAFKQLGAWFEYLRDEGVYDNTRIILVSDHARNLKLDDDLILETEGKRFDLLMFNCLLMCKDFDSDELAIDDSFMTNADTPVLAVAGLVDDPVNPYTGSPLDSAYKEAPEQHLLYSNDHDTSTNNGEAFLPGSWFSVQGDIFAPENWKYLGWY